MDNPEDKFEFDDQEKPEAEHPPDGIEEDPAERFRRLTSRASLPPEPPEDGTIGIYRGSPPEDKLGEEEEVETQQDETSDESELPKQEPNLPLEFDDKAEEAFYETPDVTSIMAATGGFPREEPSAIPQDKKDSSGSEPGWEEIPASDQDVAQEDDLFFDGIPEKLDLPSLSLIEETPPSGMPADLVSSPEVPGGADADTDLQADLADTSPVEIEEPTTAAASTFR